LVGHAAGCPGVDVENKLLGWVSGQRVHSAAQSSKLAWVMVLTARTSPSESE